MDATATLNWSQTFSLWITALLGALVFFRSLAVIRFDKRADVLMHCNDRYDSLLQAFCDCHRQYDETLERRYWNLQSDNLDYFVLGYLDADSVAGWLLAAHQCHRNNVPLLAFTISESWARVGKNRQAADDNLALVMRDVVLTETEQTRQSVTKVLAKVYDSDVARRRRAYVRSR